MNSRSRCFVAGLLGLALALCALVAWAAPSRVAIVRPKKPRAEIAEATTRLAAELRAAGFEVVLVDARAGVDARAQVERTKLDPRPFATIALVSTERGAAADVWVADHLSDKTLVRRVDVAADAQVPSALAIRAVELLRASLLEVGSAPRPGAPLPEDVARWMAAPAGAGSAAASAAAPPATPGTTLVGAVAPPGVAVVAPPAVTPPAPVGPPPAAARAPRSGAAPAGADETAAATPPAAARRGRAALLDRTSIEGGAAWLHGFRGLGASFAPTLRVTLPLRFGFAGRASLLAPAIGEELSSAAGSVALRQELFATELVRAFGDDGEGALVPLVSAGIGGHHLHAEGRGEKGYSARSVDAWAFAILGGGGLSLRLTDSAALWADARAVALLPEPIVRIAEAPAGRAGTPMLLVTLGVLGSF